MKWCPFVRFVSEIDGEGTFNRGDVDPMNLVDDGDDFIPRCIGSACMAWRWRTVPNPDWQPPSQMAMWPPANPYSATPQGIASATDGFCGLAGPHSA